jgi:hypothetical protein
MHACTQARMHACKAPRATRHQERRANMATTFLEKREFRANCACLQRVMMLACQSRHLQSSQICSSSRQLSWHDSCQRPAACKRSSASRVSRHNKKRKSSRVLQSPFCPCLRMGAAFSNSGWWCECKNHVQEHIQELELNPSMMPRTRRHTRTHPSIMASQELTHQ